MQELVPYISVLVNPHEVEAALASNYSQIYINGHDGYYKHMKLVGDRFVRVKIPALPKIKGAAEVKEVKITEEINFLPAGKIPYAYLEQLVAFFKAVMTLKKADYEAHAWVLWNAERGYYISVPKQTVSKAAVTFSYDAETLPPGDIIVVDIH